MSNVEKRILLRAAMETAKKASQEKHVDNYGNTVDTICSDWYEAVEEGQITYDEYNDLRGITGVYYNSLETLAAIMKDHLDEMKVHYVAVVQVNVSTGDVSYDDMWNALQEALATLDSKRDMSFKLLNFIEIGV